MQFKDVPVGQRFTGVAANPGAIFKKTSTVSVKKGFFDDLFAKSLAKSMAAQGDAEVEAILDEVEAECAPFLNAEWLTLQPDSTRAQTGCFFLDDEDVNLL